MQTGDFFASKVKVFSTTLILKFCVFIFLLSVMKKANKRNKISLFERAFTLRAKTGMNVKKWLRLAE